MLADCQGPRTHSREGRRYDETERSLAELAAGLDPARNRRGIIGDSFYVGAERFLSKSVLSVFRESCRTGAEYPWRGTLPNRSFSACKAS